MENVNVPQFRCGLCQEEMKPRERRTYIDQEPCHVDCAMEYVDSFASKDKE